MIEHSEEFFNSQLLPVFNNFEFSGYEPFKVAILEDKSYSDYLTLIFVQGCLFKQISFLEKNIFDYKSYLPYYKKIEEKFINEERFFFYKDIPLVKIGYYKENDAIGELVYPLLKECIEEDLKIIND